MKVLTIATIVLAVGLATVVASAQQSAPAQTPQAPAGPSTSLGTGNADTGKKLFVSYGCYQCHGYEAQGSSATGPRLGPRPLPFAALTRYVRQPTGQMPGYSTKVVSDADLANIYAFLQSRPAPAKDIPLLR